MLVLMLSIVLAALVSLPTPAKSNASVPYLTTAKSGVMMTWIEGKTLKFATLANGKWSEPRVIVKRDDLMVNWADFPSITEDAKGTLFAQWLRKGKTHHASDVWISASSDGGRTWRTPRVLHRDTKPAEHGFVSMMPLPNGGVATTWLNGVEGGSTELRYAEVDAMLKTKGETVLDERVCDCCATAMTMTADGPVVAFRDRSNAEIRDVAVTRRVKGIWSKPARAAADGWKIKGCPVNGPQLASRGNDVAIAWFSAADTQPRVEAAFSRDGGATFGKPVRIDTSNAIGRVDTLMLADGSALVTWIEGDTLLARRITPDGHAAPPTRIATVAGGRAAGVPRATLAGDTAYVAWTDPATNSVRVVSFRP